MNLKRSEMTGLLEGGLFLLGVSLLTGLLIFIGGRVSAELKHQQRRSFPAPKPRTVPKNRHENIGAVSTR